MACGVLRSLVSGEGCEDVRVVKGVRVRCQVQMMETKMFVGESVDLMDSTNR